MNDWKDSPIIEFGFTEYGSVLLLTESGYIVELELGHSANDAYPELKVTNEILEYANWHDDYCI